MCLVRRHSKNLRRTEGVGTRSKGVSSSTYSGRRSRAYYLISHKTNGVGWASASGGIWALTVKDGREPLPKRNPPSLMFGPAFLGSARAHVVLFFFLFSSRILP
jgi:hypothetical protein